MKHLLLQAISNIAEAFSFIKSIFILPHTSGQEFSSGDRLLFENNSSPLCAVGGIGCSIRGEVLFPIRIGAIFLCWLKVKGIVVDENYSRGGWNHAL